VFDEYGGLSAFELVVMTHSEKPWVEARKGRASTDPSGKKLEDRHFRDQFAYLL